MIKIKKCSIIIGIFIPILISFLGMTLDIDPISDPVLALENSYDYLPIIQNHYPISTVFGIVPGSLTDSGVLERMNEAGPSWARINGPLWSLLEPTEGMDPLLWENAQTIEQELINAYTLGLETVLIIRSVPDWAQNIPGFPCGPIRQDKLAAFATFLIKLVERYSIPPYNVVYWELWNEPDIDPDLVQDPNGGIGCWGNSDDEYYGGDYFADMLSIAYPAIKSVDPDAQVLIGGLLLDCDPRNPGACENIERARASAFLEGILRHSSANDGGEYFDGVSFHAYDFYEGAEGVYANTNWNSTWDTNGPVHTKKSEFIRETLYSYGYTEKYLINTESGLLCDVCTNDNSFEMTKADYLIKVYTISLKEGHRANFWYNLFGWRNSGLLNLDQTPKPAFYTFQTTRKILGDSIFLENIGEDDVTESSFVMGAKFQRRNRQVWVIWSRDGLDRQITLIPGVPSRIFDHYENPIATSSSLIIGDSPIFLEWD